VTELVILFGVNGNAEPYLDHGWSPPEPDATWTRGGQAVLAIPRPEPADYRLILTLDVFRPDPRPWQRVTVSLGDTVLSRFLAGTGPMPDIWIPRRLIEMAPDSMPIRFDLPDAARPMDFGGGSDDRFLALAFRRLELHRLETEGSGIAAFRDAAMATESLGSNCLFGLVQRAAGAEPLGLLRFATSGLATLTAALAADFSGLGDLATTTAELHAPDGNPPWIVRDRRYGFVFHTDFHPDRVSREDILAREARRQPWLARKLRDDLASGEKLFVYQGDAARSPDDVAGLARDLRRRARGWLLLVLPDPARAGEVARRDDNLLVGYVSALPDPAVNPPPALADWERVLVRAVAIWRDARRGDEPEERFDEAWYLAANPGVAEAVRRGEFASGRAHYDLHGRAEGRAPGPPARGA